MSNEHFSITDDAIAPQPWMQLRHLTGAETASVSKTYDTSGGGNKNEPVHAVLVSWTNNTPLPQFVYGMVTREGAQVALQARSRGYLLTSHGQDITATPEIPSSWDMVEVSRFGVGGDFGKGGVLALGTGFGVSEVRQNSSSVPLMPHLAGWNVVQPGRTYHGRVEVRFRTDFWENTMIDGGDQGTVSGFTSGGTRLDLYAAPAIIDPGPRLVPQLVGVEHSINFGFPTDVDVPAGTAAGDVMIAIHANQGGLYDGLAPQQPGWELVHSRDAGFANSHTKVYLRIAGADEPDSYTFSNNLGAEAITQLIVLRDAAASLDEGWQFASSLMSMFWWDRQEGHIAPSVDRAGQYLIAVSYVPHAVWQEPMTQAGPEGMTVVKQSVGNFSNMTSAVLAAPPRPTGQRAFQPDKRPDWAGRSMTLTILVPGTQPGT
ncbi:hypothetical protein [Mycolicibacterium sp.]|uniref:DUF7172 family protein n=1 Tax=Mycolicibacterium sp. TaxID=2320850 RepID=UPI00355DA5B7